MFSLFPARGYARRWLTSLLVCSILILNSVAGFSASHASPERPVSVASGAKAAKANDAEAKAKSSLAALPLRFEANAGQTDGRVKFMARAGGYMLFLTDTEAVMKSAGAVVRVSLAGASRAAQPEALDQLEGETNYFGGEDPAGWHTGIKSYASVRYAEVYPGMDLIYYGRGAQLEYDFRLKPGADPSRIALSFKGVKRLEVNGDGALVMHTAGGQLVQHKPYVYQEIAGVKQEVEGGYVIRGGNRVGFRVGQYDAALPLVIDPVLAYSTYLGGTGYDSGVAVAVDAQGNAYVAGNAFSTNFPTTSGAYRTTPPDTNSSYVAKFNPAGNALVYSTFIQSAEITAIAVDAGGNAYLTGDTGYLGFPITPGAFQTPQWGFETFITKLNATGSELIYSSRFGGDFDDFGRDIAIDASGNAYITGWTVSRAQSRSFPTVNAFQPNYGGGNNDAFVTKMNATGTALVYSTYLGGGAILNNTDDWGDGIAVDAQGSAYVTGYTYSPDFPVTPGAFDTSWNGLDAFVTKFSPDGSQLIYSTFLGGLSRDQGYAIAVDSSGNAFVAGATNSWDSPTTSTDEGFPTTPGVFQPTGSFEGFVTKLNATGTGLIYSTYLGGGSDDGHSGEDRIWGIAIDGAGNAYVTGDTNSATFPVVNAIQPVEGGGLKDAFVSKLNAGGTALIYSTYLGGSSFDEGRGIAVDANGNAYAVGNTSSYNFPTTPGAFQSGNGGGLNSSDDAYAVKISEGSVTPPPPSAPALNTLTLNPSTVTGGKSVQGTVTLTGPAPTGGALVSLSSTNTAVATVPASVTVPAGATSASFNVTTSAVSSTNSLYINASYDRLLRSTMLIVNSAPAPAPTDTVSITRAEYGVSKKELRVEASSTSASATLKAYVSSTGALIGTLTNSGGGKYTGQFTWSTNPQNITVRSSLGGSATKAVTAK
jgi:hypothetical protein